MIVGLSVATFTLVHVLISLMAIACGLVALFGMLNSHRMPGWNLSFLIMTTLTSLTGFLFPIQGFTPGLALGALSLVLLLIACVALYGKHLVGSWRWIYAATAISALYFNLFVLVVQSFQKVSVLQPLAPTQSEPPFLIAQTAMLVVFVILGIITARRFHPERYKPEPRIIK